ncbi:hypothetical protein BT69DRAFT_155461 [Atractiella rhizophila]|nr:hypothetical protein BT69DRAFT_155461 [Atractiella rhizophila]
MKLLMTGKFTFPLQDFMSSKATERSVNQWWASKQTTLEQLITFCYRCLSPAMERTIIILEELLHEQTWFQSPLAMDLEQSELFRFDLEKLESSIQTCKLLILLSSRLEKAAKREMELHRDSIAFFRYSFARADNPNEYIAPTTIRPDFAVSRIRSYLDEMFDSSDNNSLLKYLRQAGGFDEQKRKEFDKFWDETDNDLNDVIEKLEKWTELKEQEVYDPCDAVLSDQIVVEFGILDCLWLVMGESS